MEKKGQEKSSKLYALAEERLTEFILAHSMRKTPERYEVLRAVCEAKGLFTIDQLTDQITAGEGPNISRVTVFHALDVFMEAGIVIKHTLQRAALYECNLYRDPRVLQICSHCGAVQECKNDILVNVLAQMRNRQFVTQQPILYLHGLCSKCYRAHNKRKISDR